MNALRTIRNIRLIAKRIRPLTSTRRMSLFPRSFITNDQSPLPPILRLLDEFDQFSRTPETRSNSQLRSFTPKFDVKEQKESYELYGELPGIDQKDIEIEFTDASTLTIKGHTERSYSEGHPPAGLIEDSKSSGNKDKTITVSPGEGKKEKHEHNEDSGVAVRKETRKTSDHRFWVMERSVGEFSRSFSFPTPVDQESVKASMKNGILSINVPKAKKPEGRKIRINS